MKQRILSAVLSAAMVLSAIPAPHFSAADALPELRVHYKFDDNGVTTADSSGNDRAADIFGTTETSDEAVFGRSLLLKGGYVHLPEDIIAGCTDITVSVWTNPLRAAKNSRLWDLGSNNQNFINMFAPLDENGLKFASALRINNQSTRIPAGAATFTMNAWRNITVTYTEANNGTITIYENGAQIGKGATNKKVSDLGNVVNAYIGRAQFDVDPDYYGYVDDFRIYGGALTADQVAAMSDEGFASLLQNTADRIDLAHRNNITRLDGVMQDLALTADDDIKSTGAQISWETSDAGVIASDGKIGKAGEATLTATLTRGEQQASVQIPVKVVSGEIKPDTVPAVLTVPGRKPKLPEFVTANNGGVSLAVEWDELTPNDYAFAGTKTVNGTTENGAVSVEVNIDDTYLTNPIIMQHKGGAPDPYVPYYNGYYYYVRHNYNTGITVAKAKRLQDIGSAPRVLVYQAPASGMFSKEYWAPELFFIDGKWYIYVAADDGNNANHRMYVLEGTDPGNAQAEYIMKGKIAPTKQDESGEWVIDPEQDKWAIDGTVIEDAGGRDYFVWSGWKGNVDGEQCIYIAEMLNPWTIKGDRVLLNAPSAQWERKGNASSLAVNEGPQIIRRNGKILIVYSANQSFSDWYCLGSLTADETADLLNPASWVKSKGPLFTQSLDPEDHSAATGHAMFTPSPDGSEMYLVYHAFQTLGADDWNDRSARVKKITWDGDTLMLGNPVPEGELIKQPSGTESVLAGKYEAEEAVLEGGAAAVKKNRPSGGYCVNSIGKTAKVTFNVNVPKEGKYLLSFMGSSLATSGKALQTVTVNDQAYTIFHSGVNNPDGIWTPSSDADSKSLDGLYVDMKAGENKIVVTRDVKSSANADLDYLYMVYAGEADKKPEPEPEPKPDPKPQPKPDPIVKVSSVTVKADRTKLYVGQTAKLTAAVNPAGAKDKSLTWSVSGRAVTLKNGVVTAKKPGKAIITATAKDGSGKKASVTITVLKPKKVAKVKVSLKNKKPTVSFKAVKGVKKYSIVIKKGKKAVAKATAKKAKLSFKKKLKKGSYTAEITYKVNRVKSSAASKKFRVK